LQLQFIK